MGSPTSGGVSDDGVCGVRWPWPCRTSTVTLIGLRRDVNTADVALPSTSLASGASYSGGFACGTLLPMA